MNTNYVLMNTKLVDSCDVCGIEQTKGYSDNDLWMCKMCKEWMGCYK